MAKYILNLIPNVDPLLILNCSQYDTGLRVFTLTLKNGCNTYLIPKDATVTVRGKKPDLNVFEYPVEFNGNFVTLDLKEQMTPLAGSVECELRIEQDSQLLGTANFILKVEESPINENTPVSETDIPLLERAIEASEIVVELADKIEDAVSNITVDVEQTETGAILTAKDLTHESTAEIFNGAPGAPGEPGEDGFSPIATVTQSGNDAIITITDAQGTTTATVPGGSYDDTEIRQMIADETQDRIDGDIDLQNDIDDLELAINNVYTKSESDNKYVLKTTEINGKPLSSDITLDASDVGALPDDTVIPSKVSDLTNDSGYQTSSDVSSAISSAIGQLDIPEKTSDLQNDSGFITNAALADYATDQDLQTAIRSVESQIPENVSDLTNDAGYQTSQQVDALIAAAIADIDIPTKTSDLTNDSGYQTSSDVSSAISSAIGQLDIPEKTSDLQNDSGFITNAALADYATDQDLQDAIDALNIPTKTSDLTNDSDFVSDANYVHTDNNFTTALKDKLAGIQSGAEVNVQSDWSQSDNTADDYIKNKPTIPTDTSDLTNGAGYITNAALSGYATETYVRNYVNSLNANNTEY